MILFYSEYCPHCRMLLDTVNRHDVKKQIKPVSIDALRAQNKPLPPQIHSVPALYVSTTKDMLFGKQVFDYLLLPGKGKLLVDVGPAPDENAPPASAGPSKDGPMEPAAYSITSSGMSDGFAIIEDDQHPMNGLVDRSYQWTSVHTNTPISVPASSPLQEETRSKKTLLDLDAYKAQRDLELKQSDLNTTQLLPPSFTR